MIGMDSEFVGADDSVRPDDDHRISDRADRVVGPYARYTRARRVIVRRDVGIAPYSCLRYHFVGRHDHMPPPFFI